MRAATDSDSRRRTHLLRQQRRAVRIQRRHCEEEKQNISLSTRCGFGEMRGVLAVTLLGALLTTVSPIASACHHPPATPLTPRCSHLCTVLALNRPPFHLNSIVHLSPVSCVVAMLSQCVAEPCSEEAMVAAAVRKGSSPLQLRVSSISVSSSPDQKQYVIVPPAIVNPLLTSAAINVSALVKRALCVCVVCVDARRSLTDRAAPAVNCHVS